MDARLKQALFTPRSVVIVGASADKAKNASRPLRYLVNGGYGGKIYPINPRESEIVGVPCLPSIADVPEPADIAYVLLGSDAAITAVEQCGKRGIRVAMILASGFGEAGAEGKAREKRLIEAANASGVRLIGPSSIGLVNLHEKLILTGNSSFARPDFKLGGIFCGSQSGSMIGALLSRGRARHVGFAGLVSTGSELDLSLGELCEATLDDPNVTSYLLFMENLRHGDALRRFAVGAAARNKPIVALKLGRSEAAAELSTSHTGGLAGEDDVAEAFLADCGIARVETLEGLLEASTLLRRLPNPARASRAPVIGVVTTTGGGAALVVDQLGSRGIAVEGPDAETLAAVRKTGIDVAHGRIVDLTMAGVRYDVMKGALEAMLASPKFDVVVAVAGSSAQFMPELAVKPIVDVAQQHGRLAAFLVPEAPDALAMLADADVPAFRTPEACADVIAAAMRRRPARALETPKPPAVAKPHSLDEMEGYELLRQLGLRPAPAVAMDIAKGSADPSMYPAVVKVLHRDVAHKTDIGGVVLNVRSDDELKAAAARIRDNIARAAPKLAVDKVLVQKMVTGTVGEVLLGYRVDPQVGPLVLLASGGVMTEVVRDRTIRMAPVNLDEARVMISELKGLKLLTGYRGRPAGDIEAIARAIVAISNLASRPEINELEINPLMVMPAGEGAFAVDVVAHLRG